MKHSPFIFALLAMAVGSSLARPDRRTDDLDTQEEKGLRQEEQITPRAGSTLDRCTELQRLTGLLDIASNSTRLDQKAHGNTTREAAIRSQAAVLLNSTTPQGARLQELRSNATLVNACQAIFAVKSSDKACIRLDKLEFRARIVANSTRLEQATRGNATRAAQLRREVAADRPMLVAMQSNTTLLEFCAAFQTRADCKKIGSLQKEVDLARNATALRREFNGNTTRIAEFQMEAVEASAELDLLRDNATLMGLCDTEAPSVLDTANQTPGSQASTDNSANSAPGHITAGSTMLVVLLLAGFLIL